MRLTVLVPLFDDWQCLPLLLADLDRELAAAGHTVEVCIVDDGSAQPPPDLAPLLNDRRAIERLAVVHLQRNVGQERAIAIGLCVVHERGPGDAVVVMDADGEDVPAAIAAMAAARATDGREIVVASRQRRHEPIWFRAFYRVFKLGFLLATGRWLDYGHYSLLSPTAVARLVQMHELWTSYSATLLVCRLPLRRVGVDRGVRYSGQSHMSAVTLIVHGMRAAAVFLEQICVRFVLALGALSAVAALVIVTAFALKMFEHASPGWASNLIATSSVIVILSALIMVVLMATLRNQGELGAQPLGVYGRFVRAIVEFGAPRSAR